MTSKHYPATYKLISGFASLLVLAVATGCAQGAPAAQQVTSLDGSASASGDIRALCEAWVDSDVAARELLTIDFVSDPPEKIQRAVIDFWAEEEVILDSLKAVAPEDLKPSLDALVLLARSGMVNGDSGTLIAPQLTASDRTIDAYMLRECPYREVPIVATDTQYQDAPSAIEAETVAITLTNRGLDKHEIRLNRVDDGVALSLPEIMAQSPAQRAALTTPIAWTETDPGNSSTVFVRLTSGRWVIYDGYPQGTTATTEGSGPPHFNLGVLGEFTVA